MQEERRLAGADFLRAMACLLVLVHHLTLRMNMYKAPEDMAAALNILRFGNFGVAVFFVLSGFLLAHPFWRALDAGAPMPDLRNYTLRRAARILPGFWLALTVAFVLGLTLFERQITSELVLRYLSGLLLVSQWHWRTFFPVEDNGPLWSIPFEVTSYILLPLGFLLLFPLRRLIAQPLALRLAWVAVIALVLVVHVAILAGFPLDPEGRGWEYGMQGGAKAWMPRFNAIGFFAIFALGALAAGVEIILSSQRRLLFDIAAIAALAVAAWRLAGSVGGPGEAYGWLGLPYDFPFFPLAAAIALVALTRSRFLAALLDNAPLRYTAKISFGIYVWQEVVLRVMQQLSPNAFGVGVENVFAVWLLSCAIAVPIIFLIASLSYILIEKPVIDWAASRTDKWKNRANPHNQPAPATNR